MRRQVLEELPDDLTNHSSEDYRDSQNNITRPRVEEIKRSLESAREPRFGIIHWNRRRN